MNTNLIRAVLELPRETGCQETGSEGSESGGEKEGKLEVKVLTPVNEGEIKSGAQLPRAHGMTGIEVLYGVIRPSNKGGKKRGAYPTRLSLKRGGSNKKALYA